MNDGVAQYLPPARTVEGHRRTDSIPSAEPRPRSPPLRLNGAVERAFVSETGAVLVIGWLADEGLGSIALMIRGDGLDLAFASDSLLRHARPDVERTIRLGAFDFGFMALGKAASGTAAQQPWEVEVRSAHAALTVAVAPETVSDQRLLDTWLIAAAGAQSHGGSAFGLHRFVAGDAGAAAVGLFQSLVAGHVARRHVHRFRPRPVERSFVTVLFGTTEPIKLQPILFREHGIDGGEWIYVCNSPEDAEATMRLARMVSDLYDLMITVIVMPDNVGFGAANNAAVDEAASQALYLLNPDVYPVPGHAEALKATLERRALGATLWGGLLFYDDQNLMHAGMYLDRDTVFHRGAPGPASRPGEGPAIDLLRVEHFDKGVPFEEARWRRPKRVPAITGAAMAFSRPAFERLGGFSTRYLYGHYEDADLSLRWAAAGGLVAVDPLLRLVHIEGHGSKPRGEQFRAAAIVNRHLFTLQHGAAFARDPGAFTVASDVPRDIAPERP